MTSSFLLKRSYAGVAVGTVTCLVIVQPGPLIKPSPLEGTPHDILYTEGSLWKDESGRRLVRGRREFRYNET